MGLWKLDDRANFHRPVGGHGNCFGHGYRLINIVCLDQEIAAQLFVRFLRFSGSSQDSRRATRKSTSRRDA